MVNGPLIIKMDLLIIKKEFILEMIKNGIDQLNNKRQLIIIRILSLNISMVLEIGFKNSFVYAEVINNRAIQHKCDFRDRIYIYNSFI